MLFEKFADVSKLGVKQHGVMSPSLSFASLCLPLCPQFHSTLSWPLSSLSWSYKALRCAVAASPFNTVCVETVRPLTPLQYLGQKTHLSVHNLCKQDVLNCSPKREICLHTSNTPPTINSLHCKISKLSAINKALLLPKPNNIKHESYT